MGRECHWDLRLMGRIDWEDGGIWRIRWTCHVSPVVIWGRIGRTVDDCG